MNGRFGVGDLSIVESFRLGSSFLVDLDVDLEEMLNRIFDELLFATISVKTDRQETYKSINTIPNARVDAPYCVPQSPR